MIFYVNNLLDKEENEQLAVTALSFARDHVGLGKDKWTSGEDSPYNSYALNDLEYPPIVHVLSDRIDQAIKMIQDQLNIDHDLKAIELWYNVYDNTHFQEPHAHNPGLFSVVYFNKMPEGSSTLTFENEATTPGLQKEGTAVIFLSHMVHGVERGNNTEPRITWSFNYQ